MLDVGAVPLSSAYSSLPHRMLMLSHVRQYMGIPYKQTSTTTTTTTTIEQGDQPEEHDDDEYYVSWIPLEIHATHVKVTYDMSCHVMSCRVGCHTRVL